jgi:uncharacterized damage-inducible protein DinB
MSPRIAACGARGRLPGDSDLSDQDLAAERKMTQGESTLLALPRIDMVRSVRLNHWYHHRGELLVYLRLLDVPVPAVYGPSADENPFARPS